MQRTPASGKGSAENRGNCCQRKHSAEILALGPSCASHRRSSNASAAGIRLDHRKSVRPFKGIIWDHISEFEYSHAVGLSASPLVSVGGAFRLASPLSRIDSQWRKARRLASPADREIRARRQFQAAKALGLAIRQTLSLSRTKCLSETSRVHRVSRRHGCSGMLTHPLCCAADRPTDMRCARAPGNRAIL